MKTAITRALSLLVVCLLVLGTCIITHAKDNAIPGDVNNDGELTIFDVLFITKAVVNGTALENTDVNGDGKTNLLDIINAIKFIATGEAPEVGESDKNTVDVVVENGTVKEAVSINGEKVSAAVPEGVAVDDGTTELTLTVSALDSTSGNITTGEDDEVVSYDVHIDGVSEENTVAIVVDLGAILPIGQNIGTVELYHVENGITYKMTQVMTLAELDEHNEFYYYPATGNVYVAMATFSEVSAVTNNVNPWKGNFDYSWYTDALEEDPNTVEFTIANADQLAAFGAIVGGMDGNTADSFKGKTVTLISDINLGDKESENNTDLIFYPIGYYNTDGTYKRSELSKDGKAGTTSGLRNFEGTFDGAGHTIANFYHNTWEMIGDHNWYSAAEAYYRDGMGLFGRIYGGTVKNLTVENFSCDGEIATTGVVAAYADCASTFENIAIFNCNPRVYNIGNGGIVGCVGWYAKETTTEPAVFKNITVDNSNKISALWGSWDVSCGGLIGQYYPTSGQTVDGVTPTSGGIYMENCHVAAQIDVNNDVCGNYQYYWYRYSGMLIGTIKASTTDANGYTVPDLTGISATDCTVNFGDWNDYYYCELVANSLASYTHDHQFSRLEVISSVDEISEKEAAGWTRTGNFLVINGDEKECYHIMKDANGKLYRHFHNVADATNPNINETVNGETVLKENNQIVYLPFNQIFQGDGWGVKHIPIYEDSNKNTFKGVTVLGKEYADSVIKFTGTGKTYTDGMTVKASDLFKAKANPLVAIEADNVTISVSPVSNSTANGTVVKKADWKNTEITFNGTGKVTVTIQDYKLCAPTTITVILLDSEGYHIDADGTSDLVWVADGNKFDLVCNGCGKIIENDAEKPVVYLDYMGTKAPKTSDFAIGTKDYPVATLVEAVKRLATSGGTIKLLSDIPAAETGVNNPKATNDQLTAWSKMITINGDYDDNGKADVGFVVKAHGSSIYFDGPTTLEYIVIDGEKNYTGTGNNSDAGLYNIPVFVANWNDFTVGEGVEAYGACYFIVGNYFYRTNGVKDKDERLFIEAYVDDYDTLTRDTDGNYYEGEHSYTSKLANDGEQKTVNVTLNKITSHATREIDGKTVVVDAYDRVYLGTRNRTYDSLTVKNAHINLTTNDATFNLFYTGSVSGSYMTDADGNKTDGTLADENMGIVLTPVNTQMENCSVDIEFNGSKSADAYIRHFRVGNANSGNKGTAYLDKLKIELNGTFYIKDSDLDPNKDATVVSEKHFSISNVVDTEVTVSYGNDRLGSDGKPVFNKEGLFFSLSDAYKTKYVATGEHVNKAKLTYGTHSFAATQYALEDGELVSKTLVAGRFNEGYDKANITETCKDECTWSWADKTGDPLYQTGTCNVCGRTQERINPESYHEHDAMYISGSAGSFTLKCEDCSKSVTMYKQPAYDTTENDKPIIYVDPQNKNSNSKDTNLGFEEDNAVVSVGVAVKRVKATGGILKFMSNINVGAASFNHPLGNTHKISDSWSKEIVFSSCYTKNGEPTVGFMINTHGTAIYFNGPAKLKDILIDGRRDTINGSNTGYFNTAVFVANWYSFATKGNVVSYGSSYLVVGHYFTSNHTVSDYNGKLPFFSYDATTGGLSDITGKTTATAITLNKTTPKPVTVDGTTQKAVVTFSQVYLGNRNATPVTAMTSANKAAYICQTKGANIIFSSYTDLGEIYVGGVGNNKELSTNNYVLTGPISESKIAIGLREGTTTEQVLMGTETFKTGDTGLDSLSIHLYEGAYINKDETKTYSITTRNVKDMTIHAEADGNRRVFGEVRFTVSDIAPSQNESWNLKLTVGNHVFAHEKGIQYNSRYKTVDSYYAKECTYDANNKCTVCGAAKASS